MFKEYPVKFSDEFGEERTTIQNDGKILKMIVKGVKFFGHDFHGFDLLEEIDETKLNQFNFFLGELCAYTLDCEIPVLVVSSNNTFEGKLQVHIEYGKPVETGRGTTIHRKDGSVAKNSHQQVVHEVLQLQISIQGESFRTSGKVRYSTFDEQLAELKTLLPPDIYLKVCWNCSFSDYSPAGSGTFCNLACFRNCKDEYHKVKTKQELFKIWDKRAEYVQEIHLCSEFEKRRLGVGGLYVG